MAYARVCSAPMVRPSFFVVAALVVCLLASSWSVQLGSRSIIIAQANHYIYDGNFIFRYQVGSGGGSTSNLREGVSDFTLVGDAALSVQDLETDNYDTIKLTKGGVGGIFHNTPLYLSYTDTNRVCRPLSFSFAIPFLFGRDGSTAINGLAVTFSKQKVLGLDGGNLGYGANNNVAASARTKKLTLNSLLKPGSFAFEVDVRRDASLGTRGEPAAGDHIGFNSERNMASVKTATASRTPIFDKETNNSIPIADFILPQGYSARLNKLLSNYTEAGGVFRADYNAATRILHVQLYGLNDYGVASSAIAARLFTYDYGVDTIGFDRIALLQKLLLLGIPDKFGDASSSGLGISGGIQEDTITTYLEPSSDTNKQFAYNFSIPNFDPCTYTSSKGNTKGYATEVGMTRGKFYIGVTGSATLVNPRGSPSNDTLLDVVGFYYGGSPQVPFNSSDNFICWNPNLGQTNPLNATTACAGNGPPPTPKFCCFLESETCFPLGSTQCNTKQKRVCSCACGASALIIRGRKNQIVGCT